MTTASHAPLRTFRPSKQSHILDLESSPAAPGEASVWARTLAELHDVSAARTGDLDLCVVELVSNVVTHGYKNGPGDIRLELMFGPEGVAFTVIDSGPPFNPLALPPPEQAESLDQARIGGLGVLLIRRFADRCRYVRREGSNVFTVAFGDEVPRRRRGDRRQASPAGFPLTRADGTVIERDERSGRDRRSLGFISRTALFRGVAWEDIEAIVERCELLDYAQGTVVLSPESQSHRVLVTVRGRLHVHFDRPGSSDFIEIQEGECVGELSVADGKPSSAWVVCAEPCQLLIVDEDVFLEELLAIPRISRNLVSLLSERMRRSNERAVERVREALELKALQRELDFARRIQSSMLPANPLLPELAGFDCHGFMRAARQVGGDFYDAIQQGPRRAFFSIGDVCHKGMPAALFMVQALGIMRAEAAGDRERPREQLERLAGVVNATLAASNEAQLFVSFFCGIADLDAGRLHYVNAGHNAPLLVRPGEGQCLINEPRNPVAGLLPGLRFEAGEVDFPAGSRCLLFTDGVTEAERTDGSQFGDEALRSVFAEEVPDAGEAVRRIVGTVDDFAERNPQSDDMTLLIVRRTD